MPDLLEALADPAGEEYARARISSLSGPSNSQARASFIREALGLFLELSEAYSAVTKEVVLRVRSGCEAAVLADALACERGVEGSFLASLCSASTKSLDSFVQKLSAVLAEPSIRSSDSFLAGLKDFFSWRKLGLLLIEASCLVQLYDKTADMAVKDFCASSAARQSAVILRLLEGIAKAPGCKNCLPGLLKLCGVAVVLVTRFPASRWDEGSKTHKGRRGASNAKESEDLRYDTFDSAIISSACMIFAKIAYMEMSLGGGLSVPSAPQVQQRAPPRKPSKASFGDEERPVHPNTQDAPGPEEGRGPMLLDLYSVIYLPPGTAFASSPDLALTLVYDLAYLALECICVNAEELCEQIRHKLSQASLSGSVSPVEPGTHELDLVVQKTLPFVLVPLRTHVEEFLATIKGSPKEIRTAFALNEEFLCDAASALEETVRLCWARSNKFLEPLQKFYASASQKRASLARGRVVVSFGDEDEP